MKQEKLNKLARGQKTFRKIAEARKHAESLIEEWHKAGGPDAQFQAVLERAGSNPISSVRLSVRHLCGWFYEPVEGWDIAKVAAHARELVDAAKAREEAKKIEEERRVRNWGEVEKFVKSLREGGVMASVDRYRVSSVSDSRIHLLLSLENIPVRALPKLAQYLTDLQEEFGPHEPSETELSPFSLPDIRSKPNEATHVHRYHSEVVLVHGALVERPPERHRRQPRSHDLGDLRSRRVDAVVDGRGFARGGQGQRPAPAEHLLAGQGGQDDARGDQLARVQTSPRFRQGDREVVSPRRIGSGSFASCSGHLRLSRICALPGGVSLACLGWLQSRGQRRALSSPEETPRGSHVGHHDGVPEEGPRGCRGGAR